LKLIARNGVAKNSISVIYVTAASRKEAEKIAEKLVEKKLVACANIFPPITAIYEWQGAMQKVREYPIILKTPAGMVKKAVAEIKKLHSYDCPCVISWKIDEGNAQFLQWVRKSTS